MYTSNHAGALWYLYAYLAYLLMLPFMRRLAKYMTNKEYMWMFAMVWNDKYAVNCRIYDMERGGLS